MLNERERRIFEARRLADDPVTLEDLAAEFGVSRERVRQIEVRAFEKVQKAVKNRIAAMEVPPGTVGACRRTDISRRRLNRRRLFHRRPPLRSLDRGDDLFTDILGSVDQPADQPGKLLGPHRPDIGALTFDIGQKGFVCIVLSKAWIKAVTRSRGTPGVVAKGRPTATDADMNSRSGLVLGLLRQIFEKRNVGEVRLLGFAHLDDRNDQPVRDVLRRLDLVAHPDVAAVGFDLTALHSQVERCGIRIALQ